MYIFIYLRIYMYMFIIVYKWFYDIYGYLYMKVLFFVLNIFIISIMVLYVFDNLIIEDMKCN